MISQRPPGSAPTVRAVANALPVRTGSFDAALSVLSVHHWPDAGAGLAETRRVARRQIVLTFDPYAHCQHWLVDYVPELADIFWAAPPVEEVAEAINASIYSAVDRADRAIIRH
jgi:ubiquinone/menaquinone biosynthesis C-methylase UbiE